MKKALRLFRCPPPSASQQALTSRGSAALERHELTSKVMLKSTHTHAHTPPHSPPPHTHTQIIFTLRARMPSVDVSWLRWKLNAGTQTVIHGFVCVAARMEQHKHSHKHGNVSDRDTDSRCVPPEYSPYSFKQNRTHTQHRSGWRWKTLNLKKNKLSLHGCFSPPFQPLSFFVHLHHRALRLFAGDVKFEEKYDGSPIRLYLTTIFTS